MQNEKTTDIKQVSNIFRLFCEKEAREVTAYGQTILTEVQERFNKFLETHIEPNLATIAEVENIKVEMNKDKFSTPGIYYLTNDENYDSLTGGVIITTQPYNEKSMIPYTFLYCKNKKYDKGTLHINSAIANRALPIMSMDKLIPAWLIKEGKTDYDFMRKYILLSLKRNLTEMFSEWDIIIDYKSFDMIAVSVINEFKTEERCLMIVKVFADYISIYKVFDVNNDNFGILGRKEIQYKLQTWEL